MYYLGIDLGGTNIAAGVVDENYKIIGEAKVKTACPRPVEDIADSIYEAGMLAIKKSGLTIDDIKEIGLGSPGSVNSDKGIIYFAANLGFNNVHMGELLEQRFNRKVFLENDANAAAYGEQLAGAGKGAKQFIAITLGTGVGGGVIINDHILSGSNYAGGELGHMVIVNDGALCTCGRNGCWEAYASASALIRQTTAAMESDRSSKMWDIAGSIDNVTGKTAFDGLRANDTTAIAVVHKYCEMVACGISNIINIFQPDIICIGGGISKEGETLVKPIREYIYREKFSKNIEKQTEIKPAVLGNDAGIIGAAFLGRLHK